MKDFKHLKINKDDGIVHVLMNRGDGRNALSYELMKEDDLSEAQDLFERVHKKVRKHKKVIKRMQKENECLRKGEEPHVESEE